MTNQPPPTPETATILFGALAPKLAKQLGTTERKNPRLMGWQKAADAITWLAIHGLLTEHEKDRARLRLLAAIKKGHFV